MTDDDARRGMILNVSDRGARKSAVTAAPRVTGEFQSVVLARGARQWGRSLLWSASISDGFSASEVATCTPMAAPVRRRIGRRLSIGAVDGVASAAFGGRKLVGDHRWAVCAAGRVSFSGAPGDRRGVGMGTPTHLAAASVFASFRRLCLDGAPPDRLAKDPRPSPARSGWCPTTSMLAFTACPPSSRRSRN